MAETPYLQRGIQLYEVKRHKQAIDNLQRALQQDPESWMAKYYLAHCYMDMNELVKSEEIANSLISEDPDNADMFFLLGWIKIKQDKEAEALAHNEQAIALNPEDAEYFGQRAYILLGLKRYEEALVAADQGLALNARNTNCLNSRAIILTKLNRSDEAAQAVENVLQENPDNQFSHASSGWVALENGNIDKSLQHFRESLKLDPNSEYARSGMSTALKGKNFLYRWYLKYAFWVGNMSSKNQWIFILGIYFAYRFGVKLLQSFDLAYLAIPLIVVYLFFALGVWIIEPLSNAILNFDSNGKYLLRQRERISGYLFFGLFTIFLLSAMGYFLFKNDYFLLVGATGLSCILPAAHGILRHKKNARAFSLAYAALMPVVAVLGLAIFPSIYTSIFAVLIMMVAYTWIGNFLS